MSAVISRAAIDAAAAQLGELLSPTPLLHSDFLSQVTGCSVELKLEVLQPTRTFKIRGAFNATLALSPAERARGVVTASGGNHGLAVAYAARRLGLAATIFLPSNAAREKIEAITALGAELRHFGSVWDEAHAAALRFAEASGRSYIHPFDSEIVMAGQATIVHELGGQCPDAEWILASIGGGGLIGGILSGVAAYLPRVKVVGIETFGADCMFQSRAAGHIVELPAITSIAETLGARRTTERPFAIVCQHIHDLVRVTDQAAIDAAIDVLRYDKVLLEPAAACSVAALLQGTVKPPPGANVVVIACGGNIDPERLCTWLTH